MHKAVASFIMFATCSLPATLIAQSLDDVCDRIAVIDVGEWILFGLSGQQGVDSMRFANVGDERIDDKVYHRYEMQIFNPRGTMVTQTVSAGRIFDNSDVKEMVLVMPGMPAQRLTGQALQNSLAMRPARSELIADEVCKSAESLGRVTVSVPAGEIRAVHIQTTDGDQAWLARSVPGGMAKVVTKEGVVMVLRSHGTGAESSIKP